MMNTMPNGNGLAPAGPDQTVRLLQNVIVGLWAQSHKETAGEVAIIDNGIDIRHPVPGSHFSGIADE